MILQTFLSSISSKYHQVVQKCNRLHISISRVVPLIDFSKMDSVMLALQPIALTLFIMTSYEIQ